MPWGKIHTSVYAHAWDPTLDKRNRNLNWSSASQSRPQYVCTMVSLMHYYALRLPEKIQLTPTFFFGADPNLLLGSHRHWCSCQGSDLPLRCSHFSSPSGSARRVERIPAPERAGPPPARSSQRFQCHAKSVEMLYVHSACEDLLEEGGRGRGMCRRIGFRCL